MSIFHNLKELVNTPKKALVAGALILLLFFAISSQFQAYKTQKMLKDPGQATEAEIQSILEKVGRLIELPRSEEPTVATVTDKSKLMNNDFFALAENGDKILIYTKLQRVIIYRPSTDKIIAAGPLHLEDQPDPVIPTKTTDVSFAVYDGAGDRDKAQKIANQAREYIPQLRVATVENSKAGPYKKTIVIPIDSTKTELAQKLASHFNAEVSLLPEGERKPVAQILIIVGKE